MPTYPFSLPPDPPSNTLIEHMRAEANTVAANIISNGGGKVARVRVEIEYTNGEETVYERTG